MSEGLISRRQSQIARPATAFRKHKSGKRRGSRVSWLPIPNFARAFALAFALLFFAVPAFCQEPSECLGAESAILPAQDKPTDQPSAQSPPQDQNTQNQKDAAKKNSGRMFYVMPNFLTVENEANVPPISWKQKFVITSKGAFDPYEFVIVGVLSGIRQADNAYPAFGQGMAGYGKRYGTALADQVDGNIMVGAVFPTILRTDPRYFQMGKGGFVKRFSYAISRIFVALRTPAETSSIFPSLWAMPRPLASQTPITPPPIAVFPPA